MSQLQRSIIALGSVALLLAACSEGPATVGEEREFTAACDKTNDGKRIAVVGYLRLPDSFTKSTSVVLRLYRVGDFRFAPIGVQTNVGNGANQVETVPNQFTDKDLKVHLANGQVVSVGTRVKVSGTVYFPLVSQEFPCSLSNPLFELAK